MAYPHENFPWRLEHDNKICHFQRIEHLHKYLEKYNLKLKHIIIGNKNGESFISSKEYEKKLRQTTGKSRYRSSGSVCRRKSSMDSI